MFCLLSSDFKILISSLIYFVPLFPFISMLSKQMQNAGKLWDKREHCYNNMSSWKVIKVDWFSKATMVALEFQNR